MTEHEVKVITIDLSSWGWPQYIYIAALAICFIEAIISHGQIKTKKANAYFSLIGIAFVLYVLSAGGFFP